MSAAMMSVHGLQLQKISLGALIIALGMLVDNAIVVTEGMLIGLHRGKSKCHGLDDLHALNVWSDEQASYVLAGTVLGPLETQPRDPLIKRRDRQRMLAIYAEPMPLSASSDSMNITSPLSRSRLIPRERMESACRKSPWP